MNIQITDNYVMTSDAYNFILNEVHVIETGKKAGKTTLVPIGYYPSVVSLCEGLISKKLRQSTKRTLKTFLQEHTELVDEIKGLFRIGITGIGTMPCSECGAKQKKD
uniref:DUF5405 domain-containing protein n=1 Tax=viral metagenome TaxID=1070528 RepID=A0A6M3KNC4_9ZZZZ